MPVADIGAGRRGMVCLKERLSQKNEEVAPRETLNSRPPGRVLGKVETQMFVCSVSVLYDITMTGIS